MNMLNIIMLTNIMLNKNRSSNRMIIDNNNEKKIGEDILFFILHNHHSSHPTGAHLRPSLHKNEVFH